MKRIIPAMALVVLCGCATMVNGRFHTVAVDSYPSGARIAVDCGEAPHDGGLTPAQVTVHRAAKECSLTLAREGYSPRQVVLRRQESRATSLNKVFAVPFALFAGLVSGVVGEAALNAGDTAGEAGFDAGMEVGDAPARQIDKHTGGAWKWVPGRVFVTLVRQE